MKKVFLVALLALASPVFAQDKPPDPGRLAGASELNLSVGDALNVGAGMNQLSSYETTDKDGKPTKGFYKFSADVRYAIAINIDVSRHVQAQFQTAVNDLVMQYSDGAGTVPPAKEAIYRIEVDKLSRAPSRAGFVRIKYEDLKLDENPIPGPVLSLILPVVQR